MKSKAVILKEGKCLESIEIGERELEHLADDMVEVKVRYCGVNFADLYAIHDRPAPCILGIECSGTVTAIGSDAVPLKIGDKVVCYDYNGGLHQSILRVKHEKCYVLPKIIDLATGASMFVNYLTAWFALFSVGNLKEGDSIFVSSCAGGVGLAIIELAKSLKGVTICGTASTTKRSFVESKGVRFVAYEDVAELNAKFDLVVESISTQTRKSLMTKLKPFGKVVIIGAKDQLGSVARVKASEDPTINPIELIFGNSAVAGLHIGLLADNHRDLVCETLSRLFSAYTSSSSTCKIYPFEQARAAYAELAHRTNIGKILLEL